MLYFFKKAPHLFLLLLFAITSFTTHPQTSRFIKVFFLYGSKPAANHRKDEPKWFGGMLGGHVGIGGAANKVFNFNPLGKFHLFASGRHFHSEFKINTEPEFWNVFGGKADSVKGVVVEIPVTDAQMRVFDSIQNAYTQQTPYDYALMGMRCGAAAYDVLARLGIMEKYSYTKTYLKIFYPKKLRRRLFAMAKRNGWVIIRRQGSVRRKWESD